MNFDDLPDPVILKIFSRLDVEKVNEVNLRFFRVVRDKMAIICKQIEKDPNFQPNVSNQELMSLIVDTSGNAKHTPRRSALAIQPSSFSTDLGKLYQIKIAKKGFIDDSDIPVWHIDDSATILVRKNTGKVDFYATDHVKSNNFGQPLTHLFLGKFLNNSCLHKN